MTNIPSSLKINWEPLHERVYRELKSAIMSARFAEGEKLAVRAIAAQLGVSPMPVRAALSRLVAEKAVEATVHGTIVIPIMTRRKFEEIMDLRILLEGRATEQATFVLTADCLDRIEEIAARLTSAAERDDADAYLDENRNFKFAIYESIDAPVQLDLIERLWLQIGPFMRLYAKDIRFQLGIDKQEAIVAALRRADGAAARQELEDDIAEGARYLLSVATFPA